MLTTTHAQSACAEGGVLLGLLRPGAPSRSGSEASVLPSRSTRRRTSASRPRRVSSTAEILSARSFRWASSSGSNWSGLTKSSSTHASDPPARARAPLRVRTCATSTVSTPAASATSLNVGPPANSCASRAACFRMCLSRPRPRLYARAWPGPAPGSSITAPTTTIRDEPRPVVGIELRRRDEHPDVPLVDQVFEGQPEKLILLGDHHHEAQVAGHQRFGGRPVTGATTPGQRPLLPRREQGVLPNVPEVQIERRRPVGVERKRDSHRSERPG